VTPRDCSTTPHGAALVLPVPLTGGRRGLAAAPALPGFTALAGGNAPGGAAGSGGKNGRCGGGGTSGCGGCPGGIEGGALDSNTGGGDGFNGCGGAGHRISGTTDIGGNAGDGNGLSAGCGGGLPVSREDTATTCGRDGPNGGGLAGTGRGGGDGGGTDGGVWAISFGPAEIPQPNISEASRILFVLSGMQNRAPGL
jgi:hypothetical protein